MQISLYNDTGVKVFAMVNGIIYTIKPYCTSVARCTAGMPVEIKLSQKLKSFALLNPFSVDAAIDLGFESCAILILDSTYVLNFDGDNDQYFKISSDKFDCDKYYEYNRMCLDDPIVKNNCTYEITRQKKIKKRVKFFNLYTALIAIAVLGITLSLTFGWESVEAGTFWDSEYSADLLIWELLGLWGICGRIRVRKRYKKVTDHEYIQACFRGYVEEDKSL